LTNKAQKSPPSKQLLDLFGGWDLRSTFVSPTAKPPWLGRPSRELLQADVGEFVPDVISGFAGKGVPCMLAVLPGASMKPSSNRNIIPGSAGFIVVHRMYRMETAST
jgi:hypothetical protein